MMTASLSSSVLALYTPPHKPWSTPIYLRPSWLTGPTSSSSCGLICKSTISFSPLKPSDLSSLYSEVDIASSHCHKSLTICLRNLGPPSDGKVSSMTPISTVLSRSTRVCVWLVNFCATSQTSAYLLAQSSSIPSHHSMSPIVSCSLFSIIAFLPIIYLSSLSASFLSNLIPTPSDVLGRDRRPHYRVPTPS